MSDESRLSAELDENGVGRVDDFGKGVNQDIWEDVEDRWEVELEHGYGYDECDLEKEVCGCQTNFL